MTTSKFPDDMFEMETPGWRTLHVEYDKYMFMNVYPVLNY